MSATAAESTMRSKAPAKTKKRSNVPAKTKSSRAEANRRNSLKSTGPRTARGEGSIQPQRRHAWPDRSVGAAAWGRRR